MIFDERRNNDTAKIIPDRSELQKYEEFLFWRGEARLNDVTRYRGGRTKWRAKYVVTIKREDPIELPISRAYVRFNKNLDRCGNHLRVLASQLAEGKGGKRMRVPEERWRRVATKKEKGRKERERERERRGNTNSRGEQS